MTRAEELAEKPVTLMELMDNVKRRLQGLIRMAEGQDENDGIQIADKAWLLATVDDVTALVDAFVVAPVVPEAKAEALAEALEALANEAARTCTEPRRFHENEEYRQQDLSGAVAHARLTLARYREGKP